MPWATLEEVRPGALGRPDLAPYDRILVSAAARELPAELVEQLAPGGRMVVPVGATMLVVVRRPDGTAEVTRHGSYSFVPLR